MKRLELIRRAPVSLVPGRPGVSGGGGVAPLVFDAFEGPDGNLTVTDSGHAYAFDTGEENTFVRKGNRLFNAVTGSPLGDEARVWLDTGPDLAKVRDLEFDLKVDVSVIGTIILYQWFLWNLHMDGVGDYSRRVRCEINFNNGQFNYTLRDNLSGSFVQDASPLGDISPVGHHLITLRENPDVTTSLDCEWYVDGVLVNSKTIPNADTADFRTNMIYCKIAGDCLDNIAMTDRE